MRAYADILRGGAPTQVFMNIGENLKGNLSAVYEVNAFHTPSYDKNIFNPATITKPKLHVYMGIEMYYGAYKSFAITYIAAEFEEVNKYLQLLSDYKKAIQEIEQLPIKGEMHRMPEVEQSISKIENQLSSLSDEIVANIPKYSEFIGLSEDEVIELLEPFLEKKI